jgi:hypothetical protein|eukprot:COSAG01_NODE_3130_length_6537_cov_24.810345_3_plen_66_part_00
MRSSTGASKTESIADPSVVQNGSDIILLIRSKRSFIYSDGFTGGGSSSQVERPPQRQHAPYSQAQ